MLGINTFNTYYSPDIEGGEPSGGVAHIEKVYTVSDNGVNKVLADLNGVALVQGYNESKTIIRTDYPPALVLSGVESQDICNPTNGLTLHIKSPVSTLSDYVYVPIIVEGKIGNTNATRVWSQLRLGFDGNGPYYFHALSRGKFTFNIVEEASGDYHYMQYHITGSFTPTFIPVSVSLWMPVLRSSLIHPTRSLTFGTDANTHGMTFSSDGGQTVQLLTERRGYDNGIRHDFRSITFPPFSVPLAVRLDGSSTSYQCYFDWCRTPYTPTTLASISDAVNQSGSFGYTIAETTGSTPIQYINSGIYAGIAETLEPITYQIPMTNFLDAWVVPTSYWACASDTIGFTPAKNHILTTDDILAEILINNAGALVADYESVYNIPNLLDGYLLMLRSDHFGYNPAYGLWKDDSINFITENDQQGIRVTDPSMITFGLTVEVTSPPTYNLLNQVTFKNAYNYPIRIYYESFDHSTKTQLFELDAKSASGAPPTQIYTVAQSGRYVGHVLVNHQERGSAVALLYTGDCSGVTITYLNTSDVDHLYYEERYSSSPTEN